MKQLMVVTFLAFAMASCNNGEKKSGSEPAANKTDAVAEVKLPFSLEKPYKNWQMMTSNDNTIAAMNSLKAFVDKDFTTLAGTIGDSIDIKFDGYADKLSRDSAIKMFSAQRPMYGDLTITMYDYESVVSADKKDEWVTIWYKQAWKDDKGKADSLNIIDDCKMQNGKLIELDEKVQRFPPAKK